MTYFVDVFHLQVSWSLFLGQQDTVPGAPVRPTLPAEEHQVEEVLEVRAGLPDHLKQVPQVLHLRA